MSAQLLPAIGDPVDDIETPALIVDLDAFEHRASWNAADRRVEAHLVSRWRQRVRIPVASLALTFEEGEAIWTESSHKYEPAQVIADGRAAGFDQAEQWIDEDARFALTRFCVSA